jgi:ribose/xylose/arabinose/galactoside ABC-type transport system permease subunit
MQDLGRTLIFLGLILAIAGAVVLALGKSQLPLGRLPGDFRWQGRGWFVSIPLATSILVSVLLTLILWIVGRFRR